MGRTESGEIAITNYRKWLVSPIPCPECTERSGKKHEQSGRRLALEWERKIMDAMLEHGTSE